MKEPDFSIGQYIKFWNRNQNRDQCIGKIFDIEYSLKRDLWTYKVECNGEIVTAYICDICGGAL